ncbi:MAG: hypothetical protein QOE37_1390 [Microbacteriaceae bacterium]|nr:hypothetical protein [Microbacteriaceae bacterium]
MFSPTIHTDFARQLQQDRLADFRIERRTPRSASDGAVIRAIRHLLRRPARTASAPVEVAPASF